MLERSCGTRLTHEVLPVWIEARKGLERRPGFECFQVTV